MVTYLCEGDYSVDVQTESRRLGVPPLNIPNRAAKAEKLSPTALMVATVAPVQ